MLQIVDRNSRVAGSLSLPVLMDDGNGSSLDLASATIMLGSLVGTENDGVHSSTAKAIDMFGDMDVVYETMIENVVHPHTSQNGL